MSNRGGRGVRAGTPVSPEEREQRVNAAKKRWEGHSQNAPQPKNAQQQPSQVDPKNIVKPEDVPARFLTGQAGEGIDVNVPFGADAEDAIANRDARALVRAQRNRVLNILRKKQHALRRWYSRSALAKRYGVKDSVWLNKSMAIDKTITLLRKK